MWLQISGIPGVYSVKVDRLEQKEHVKRYPIEMSLGPNDNSCGFNEHLFLGRDLLDEDLETILWDNLRINGSEDKTLASDYILSIEREKELMDRNSPVESFKSINANESV